MQRRPPLLGVLAPVPSSSSSSRRPLPALAPAGTPATRGYGTPSLASPCSSGTSSALPLPPNEDEEDNNLGLFCAAAAAALAAAQRWRPAALQLQQAAPAAAAAVERDGRATARYRSGASIFGLPAEMLPAWVSPSVFCPLSVLAPAWLPQAQRRCRCRPAAGWLWALPAWSCLGWEYM